MAVTNLAASHTTLCLGLSRAERGEVIVQQEAHVALVEHIVNEFLVELGSQGAGRKALCFTTGEDRASVRHGQGRHLAPDGTNLIGLAAIQADALVEDAAAHGIALHIVVVALHECFVVFFGEGGFSVFSGCTRCFCNLGVFGKELLFEIFEHFLESLGTSLLVECLLGDVVGGLVALLIDLFAQGLVVHLVAVFALHILAQFL